MKLILSAVDLGLFDAWQKAFDGVDSVEARRGSILDVECDAVVSPANSFGFMDGGIDGAYLHFFGPDIEMTVRRRIHRDHAGELVVGLADVVETGNPSIPYLIVAPTMRVPMNLVDTVNPYLAARAVFRLWRDGVLAHGASAGQPVAAVIKTIAMPGLASGVGKVPFATVAQQVRQAYDDIMLRKFSPPDSWADASERHQLLYTKKPKRLQF